MVCQTAQEAVDNANRTTTCSPGMCLWQTQEWLESPHKYPDASSQWRGAKYKHQGDTNPPAGAPVFWTGGAHGYGHAAVSVGGGKVRSTDQQSSGKVATVPISEIKADWGLTYQGWTEDIGDVDIPFLRNGGKPNPNGVKVGDTGLVIANGSLNGRSGPSSSAPVVKTRPYGDAFTIQQLSSDGKWASETKPSSSVKTVQSTDDLVPVYGTDYLHGWDVSSNNSKDWKPADDETFGWVKCTEGKSYLNPDYDEQLKKSRDAEQVTGHYHWLNNGDVTAQVDWFKANADVKPGETIAVDWEDKSNPTTAQKDDAIRQLQAAFPNNRVGLYCNRDWWLNHDTSGFYGDFLWIANYTSADNPGIQAKWLFWQYTSSPYDKNRGAFASVDTLKSWAMKGGPSPEPDDDAVWYSTDYLFPQVKPDPKNAAGIKKGDTVEVTADTLTARILPGGPPSDDPPSRSKGYQFDVTGDPEQGWITGGSNWYSSDYLKKVGDSPTPPPAKPGWKSTPKIVLPMKDVPGSVSYLQGVMYVNGCTTDEGKVYDPCWIVAQDYDNKGDIRFLKFDDQGKFQSWMQVNDAGHGQSIYAYRSAAGNLYVWCGENPAYRYSWQSSKKVSKSSGTKMDYGGARPMPGYGADRVAFRDATDTKETFSIFDRTDFTDGSNRSKPIKKVTVSKRSDYTQQSTACNESRILRIMGSTADPAATGGRKHIIDIFDWSGKLLLDRFDITAMHRSGCDEDEPEGVCFSTDGKEFYAAKREGTASASKRAYVVWTLTGLP